MQCIVHVINQVSNKRGVNFFYTEIVAYTPTLMTRVEGNSLLTSVKIPHCPIIFGQLQKNLYKELNLLLRNDGLNWKFEVV